MELLFFAPLWGSEHLPFEAFLDKALKSGYDGVEINLPTQEFAPDEALKRCDLVRSKGLSLILQNVETFDADFDLHRAQLIERVNLLTQLKPEFINSHTGRDFFSFEQNLSLIDSLASIEQTSGVKILNETHRSRFNFAAHVCAEFVKARPNIKQTADYSHFCCVAGTLLEEQQQALNTILPTIEHIHARVGFSEGPQVSAPDAPEYAHALRTHLSWWMDILRHSQKQQAKRFTITCEFGPPPYMPTLPFTQKVLSNQWQANEFMKTVIEREWNEHLANQ